MVKYHWLLKLKQHILLLLLFHWLTQVTWPYLTLRGWGGAIRPCARKERQLEYLNSINDNTGTNGCIIKGKITKVLNGAKEQKDIEVFRNSGTYVRPRRTVLGKGCGVGRQLRVRNKISKDTEACTYLQGVSRVYRK